MSWNEFPPDQPTLMRPLMRLNTAMAMNNLILRATPMDCPKERDLFYRSTKPEDLADWEVQKNVGGYDIDVLKFAYRDKIDNDNLVGSNFEIVRVFMPSMDGWNRVTFDWMPEDEGERLKLLVFKHPETILPLDFQGREEMHQPIMLADNRNAVYVAWRHLFRPTELPPPSERVAMLMKTSQQIAANIQDKLNGDAAPKFVAEAVDFFPMPSMFSHHFRAWVGMILPVTETRK